MITSLKTHIPKPCVVHSHTQRNTFILTYAIEPFAACALYYSSTAVRTSQTCVQRLLIPVAAPSKACVFGGSFAGNVGSNPGGGIDVSCEGRVLSDHRVGLITRPEESYRVWCV